MFGFSDTWQLAINSRNELIDLENAPDQTVELHRERFREIAEAARAQAPDVMEDKPVRMPNGRTEPLR